MSGEAPKDLDTRREETLGAISSAPDVAALEEVRVRTLGKSGWLTEKLKELGKLAAEQRKEAGARLNRVREEIQAFIEKKRAELEQAAVAAQSSPRKASTSRCRAAVRRAVGCIPVTKVRLRIEQLFRQAGFTIETGPGNRRRLPQLRGAEHPRRSSGAGDARHFLFPGRQAAAHAHLAGADPRHARAASRHSR